MNVVFHARVYLFNSKKEVLILKRSVDDDYRPGEWGCVGGGVDFGEEVVNAAIRETQEEAGLIPKIIDVVSTFSFRATKEKNTTVVVISCVGYVDDVLKKGKKTKPIVKLSHEHSDLAWVKLDELDKYEISKLKKEDFCRAFNSINRYFTSNHR